MLKFDLMNELHYISTAPLKIATVYRILEQQSPLALSPEAIDAIEHSYAYLHDKLASAKKPIYGINTGFGSLCDTSISAKDLAQLQENIVVSHACGTGPTVPPDIVKIMLLLKIQSLSYGYSGVHLQTVQRLIDFYNHDLMPIVYQQGSLGASGDLAPLAHLSLPLLGKGYFHGPKGPLAAEIVLKNYDWTPITLAAKEGLALLNGTQFMSAYGVNALIKSYRLMYLSDMIAALSMEAFNCNNSALDAMIHLVRPHAGQINTAERITAFIADSQMALEPNKKVQDPYSFRCVPQVHGATKDTISFVHNTFHIEINSVTDNPLVFGAADKIISGGNFHGQPLAFGLDFMAIAMAELGSISERRTYQLISGTRGLPAFLVQNPGLNSGLMILQYTAASIVSQNKQLATPASVDSIVSSNGQEDHVSMGANAATKCAQILNNVTTILAIELINASQAMSFRNNHATSDFLTSVLRAFREDVPLVDQDRIFSTDIQQAIDFLEHLNIDPDELF
jgi:histidine ammonia-lyase